jgi:hypothetical protein
MKPLARTSTIWSPELAYAVGLIATDGNLSSDGRHIIFVSKDKGQIETFKRCLKSRNKVGMKKSGFTEERKYYYVALGDVMFYKWLVSIGLTPNKTKTIGALKVPNRYFFDFVRGHLDGDGSCFSYWDPRWKSSFMFYISFTSASLFHLQWLQNKLVRLINIKGYIAQDGRGVVWSLKYAKKAGRILFKHLYKQQNSPRLMRKYRKLLKILETDKKHADVSELVDEQA